MVANTFHDDNTTQPNEISLPLEAAVNTLIEQTQQEMFRTFPQHKGLIESTEFLFGLRALLLEKIPHDRMVDDLENLTMLSAGTMHGVSVLDRIVQNSVAQVENQTAMTAQADRDALRIAKIRAGLGIAWIARSIVHPTLSSISIRHITTDTIGYSITTSREAILHCVVLPIESPQPTAATIKTGTSINGTAGAGTYHGTISGLIKNVDYNLWIISTTNRIDSTPVKISVPSAE